MSKTQGFYNKILIMFLRKLDRKFINQEFNSQAGPAFYLLKLKFNLNHKNYFLIFIKQNINLLIIL
jgi:hypothetical protein